jgi:tetratricopeptide (TPR) repeat protein
MMALGVLVAAAMLPGTAESEVPDPAVDTRQAAADESSCLRLLRTGYESLDAGDLELAATSYRQASEIAPTPELKFQALLGLGSASTMLDRLDEAREALESALAVFPDNATAWYSLATLHLEAGRDADAMAALHRACELAPEFAAALYDRCLLLAAAGRHADAAADCRRAVESDPGHGPAWLGLAVARYQLEDFESAAVAFTNALEIDPENARAVYGLGLCHLYVGDTATATDQYVRLKPLDAELARDLYLRIIDAQDD